MGTSDLAPILAKLHGWQKLTTVLKQEMIRLEKCVKEWYASLEKVSRLEKELAQSILERANAHRAMRDATMELTAVSDGIPLRGEGTQNRPLTKREKLVLIYIRSGLTNKEIAKHMGITERTVKFFVSSLLAKFKVDNRRKL
jgi:DNA-binding NarL/FixJ family response regulator